MSAAIDPARVTDAELRAQVEAAWAKGGRPSWALDAPPDRVNATSNGHGLTGDELADFKRRNGRERDVAVRDARPSLAERLRESSRRLADMAERGVPEVEYVTGSTFAYGMFYAGATNVLAGNFETFKTTLALQTGLEVLRSGGTFLHLDWEGGEADTLSRMFALGATAEDLRAWIDAGRLLWEYAPPIDLYDEDATAELHQLLDGAKPALVLWDSWIALLRRHGGDENDANTSRDVIDRLNALSEATGASQIVIAHRGLNTKKWVASRGSTALEDGTFGAYRVDKTAHEDDHATLELHRIKSRRGGLWTRHDIHVTIEPGKMRPMRLRAAESDSPYGRAWRAVHEYLEGRADTWVTFTELREQRGGAIPHDEPLVRTVLEHAAEDPGSPIELHETEQGKRTYRRYRHSAAAAQAMPATGEGQGF